MIPDIFAIQTRTTQVGTNYAAKFQEKVAECFTELLDNIKAWIDDFMIFARDKYHLLEILRKCFTIFCQRKLIVSLKSLNSVAKKLTGVGKS